MRKMGKIGKNGKMENFFVVEAFYNALLKGYKTNMD